MRLITDIERRSRLARRHAISPQHRVADAEAAIEAMLALHATEPATPYLSTFARTEQSTPQTLEDAQVSSRTVVKQLAMRRTVFLFNTSRLPQVLGGPSARVARQESTKLRKDIEAAAIAEDGQIWMDTARSAVLNALKDHREASAQELREQLPELSGQVSWFAHKPYGNVQHIAPRVLSWMGAAGDLVRGGNDGTWRTNRHRWARMDDWFGEPVEHADPRTAYEALVSEYLRAFGPVTETDLVWWFGTTKRAIRDALADLAAVQVQLERDQRGWVLPDDEEPEPPVEPWAAVLPALDPTSLGWKEKDFYLPPDFYPSIFDWSGNCGTTAWWNGQIIGSYVQDDAGHVELLIGRDPGIAGRKALQAQSKRLDDWLDGTRINAAYKSPMSKVHRTAAQP
ncbi:winged helix DNA-binding domain-containing protein [Arthrobacter sp. NPDC080073]|uniref:winged helix DNA-binding domain-containing protein n=1 Tax=Arthrobacter sp. NPDC080073 TaxID=3155919 RepID=UPI00342484C0